MRESIALTWATLNARLRNLRAGAIVASSFLVLAIIAALWLRSGWVWSALPMLAALGAGFFWRDQRLVYRWEDSVLAAWGGTDLCMGILVKTMAEYPGALKKTLKAMVAHLPENKDYLIPHPDSIKAERCLFWIRTCLDEMRLLRAATLNLALASLPLILWLCLRRGPEWLPLAALPLAAIPIARWAILAAGLRRWSLRTRAIAPWKPVSAAEFTVRMEALDWSRLPARLKSRLTASAQAGFAAAPGSGTAASVASGNRP